MVSISRFLIALVPIAACVGVTALLLLDRLRCRLVGTRPPPATGWRRAGKRLAVCLTLLLLPAALWACFEPYWPEVTRVRIESEKIHGRPLRIVHLSDLHSDPSPRLETRLPGIIAGLKPDLIVFTGDAINSRGGLPVFRECLRELGRIAPVYAVRGNWEVWWFRDPDVLAGTEAIELDGRAVTLRIGENDLWLAGAPVDGESLLAGLAPPPGVFSILLHHFPSAVLEARRIGTDLFLCGDTHGGQVRLPLLGELVRIYRDGVWREAGLGREGATAVYVNRGIGMEGGVAPRVRFLCRPEITVIEVCPAR